MFIFVSEFLKKVARSFSSCHQEVAAVVCVGVGKIGPWGGADCSAVHVHDCVGLQNSGVGKELTAR